MESWIGEVRGLANRLKAIDVDVSDEDMIVVLTAGLPTSYTPIVISFDALESTKLTLDFVITRLLNEEAFKKVAKPFHHSLQLMLRQKIPTSIQHLMFPSSIPTFSASIVC